MKKTVLITGCSSGIGKATAKHFAALGWNVVATMRRPDKETDLKRIAGALVMRLDVQDIASIKTAVGEGIARFGRIDALVNNAGYGQYGLFEAIPRAKVVQQFEVNVFGVMDVTRAILPHFRRNKSGVIVNISSGAGVFTLPMLSLYCASKFALEGFTEALAYELASQNIRVKSVLPHGGVTETKFGERQAQEQERTADRKLADYADFVTATNAAFAGFASGRRQSADDVAKVVYEATIDGTDRLRYFVGDDSRGILKARYASPDEDYVAFMRGKFTPAS